MPSPAVPIIQPSLAAIVALPPGISGETTESLERWFRERGEPAFRVRQVLDAVWRTDATGPEAISTLPGPLRAALATSYRWDTVAATELTNADDGATVKALHHLGDGVVVESVLIHYAAGPGHRERNTLCVSSQAGCAVGCPFCATGELGFGRDLLTSEIVDQVRAGVRRLAVQGRQVTNVVFMGMGEPLANYRNVVPAMQLMLDDLGYDLSRRRVTLSTSGLVPQIYRLAEECNVALAVSLHAPNDALRNELVPINRKHPIAELLAACWHYLERQNGRNITFEYTMLDGINDQPEHAIELAQLLRGHEAKVNLIPFNTFPGTQYRRSPAPVIARFRDLLVRHGTMATIRKTRGDDIDAACGQLKGRVRDRTQVRLGQKLINVSVQP